MPLHYCFFAVSEIDKMHELCKPFAEILKCCGLKNTKRRLSRAPLIVTSGAFLVL
jgi:hypothetical protein